MLIDWHQTLAKTLLWIVVEIYLDFVGLDNLADYSEFIFERHGDRWVNSPVLVVNTPI